MITLTAARLSCAADVAEFLRPRLRRAADLLTPPESGDEGCCERPSTPAEVFLGSAVEEVESASRCPLCAFPTVVWAPPASLVGTRVAILRDFPAWRPAGGCCEHCADRYAGLAAQTH